MFFSYAVLNPYIYALRQTDKNKEPTSFKLVLLNNVRLIHNYQAELVQKMQDFIVFKYVQKIICYIHHYQYRILFHHQSRYLIHFFLNLHQYSSQFLSFLARICILLKCLRIIFLFALITESSIIINKHLHGAFSLGIVLL